jgi:hypothetical protein
MNRKMPGDRREGPHDAGRARWATLVESDVTGIDADIDMLVGRLQAQYGFTRPEASADLVRKLSSLVWPVALGLPLTDDGVESLGRALVVPPRMQALPAPRYDVRTKAPLRRSGLRDAPAPSSCAPAPQRSAPTAGTARPRLRAARLRRATASIQSPAPSSPECISCAPRAA